MERYVKGFEVGLVAKGWGNHGNSIYKEGRDRHYSGGPGNGHYCKAKKRTHQSRKKGRP